MESPLGTASKCSGTVALAFVLIIWERTTTRLLEDSKWLVSEHLEALARGDFVGLASPDWKSFDEETARAGECHFGSML